MTSVVVETAGPRRPLPGEIRNVVFAGGGGRCIWQVGFWHAVADSWGLGPSQLDAVAAVSAGAAMATCLLAGREDAAMEAFAERMAANPKNFYPERLLARGRRAFPQSEIYRAAMLDVIDDEALARLKQGPPLYILLAAAPWYAGPRSGALLGMLCYRTEKALRGPLHPSWGQRAGFTPWVVKAQDCDAPEALIELILQSSCTPPFTPLYRRDGYPVLDGGLVDNVPVLALPEEALTSPTLVLLSRPYPPETELRSPARMYVQPSRKAPITTWDYTSPEKLQQTYDLGRRDGATALQRHAEERHT